MNKLAPSQIKALREAARLSQSEAAALVGATRRTWQNWEAPEGTGNHRAMDLGTWERFAPLAVRAVAAFDRVTHPEAIRSAAEQLLQDPGYGVEFAPMQRQLKDPHHGP